MTTPQTAVSTPARAELWGIPLPLGLTRFNLALIALLGVAYVIFRRASPPALAFDEGAFQNIGQVFAPLVLVAAFIERAVEVVLTPTRGAEAGRLQAKAEAHRAAGEQEEASEHDRRITEHKLGSRRRAFFLAVSLGVLASLLGVRGVENLLAADPAPGAGFQFFDIVLTGLVIGGGADGIHKIVKAVTDYMEMVSRKSQASG